MGEARRRKQAGRPIRPGDSNAHRDAINEAFRAIESVGQGVMETWFYTAELILAHLLYKPNKDVMANARCIDDFRQEISHPDADCLCLFCDNGTFSTANMPRVIVIVRPSIDAIVTKSHVICNGICTNCAGNLDTTDDYRAIGARIFEFYSKHIDADLCLITPTAAGHA